MSTLIELMLSKLGLADEPKLHNKTTELLRLLELRSTNVPTQINDYGKIVLCTDIAATLLSIEFDKDLALKLANLRKTQYANFKRLFEKLLDVSRLVSTKDICIQLGLSAANQKADELLALYDKIVGAEDANLDIKHPQYATMAVFQACKALKLKVNKPKIMSFSNLRPSQWVLLEQRWDKFLTQHHKRLMQVEFNRQQKMGPNAEETTKCDSNKDKAEKRKKGCGVEDYEQWKKRVLDMAHAQLQCLEAEIEKENI